MKQVCHAVVASLIVLNYVSLLNAQPSEPSFEVASVRMRPTTRGPRGIPLYQAEAGRLTFTNVSLISVISEAYMQQPSLISGLPPWAINERFDISARAATEVERSELLRMLRPLLSERFAMMSHLKDRKERGWALVVAREVPKLIPADPGGPYEPYSQSAGKLTARGISMGELATSLSRNMPFPVVDQTGLQGLYDIDLNLELGSQSAVVASDYFAELRRAIAAGLGLRIEEREVSVPFLIIDRIELPSEN